MYNTNIGYLFQLISPKNDLRHMNYEGTHFRIYCTCSFVNLGEPLPRVVYQALWITQSVLRGEKRLRELPHSCTANLIRLNLGTVASNSFIPVVYNRVSFLPGSGSLWPCWPVWPRSVPRRSRPVNTHRTSSRKSPSDMGE